MFLLFSIAETNLSITIRYAGDMKLVLESNETSINSSRRITKQEELGLNSAWHHK